MFGTRGRRSAGSVLLSMAVLIFLLLALALGGCGAAGGANPTDAQGPEVPGENVPNEDVPRETVSITDQVGRVVEVPVPIETVFCTSPMGTNLLYTLAPEVLVGWNITPTALEKEFIPEKYRQVVGLGGWFGKNTTGNVEEIIKRDPDVILDLGTLDEADISEADRIQGLVNIPVVVVDGGLTESGEAFRYIGRLLGLEERAEQLAAYCDEVLAEAQANTARLADTDRIRVYYAEGPEGLNTDPEGSGHTEVLTLVGGANVAQVEISSYGMSPVSFEQVLLWNPDVILVASDPSEESGVYEQIMTGSRWADISAVKTGRVYQIPRGPFDWFDRPPSIGRILGVKWLGNLLYPELYPCDMEAEVRDFYRLFLHIDLTDAQLERLLARALAE